MIEFLGALALSIVNFALLVLMPPIAKCPTGWSLGEGVRRTGERVGSFRCDAPLPPCCGEPTGVAKCQGTCPAVERFHSRIYCTGGMLPIVVDQRTVGCQR